MADPDQVAAPPLGSAVPVESICGGDELDTKLLREMADEAAGYIRSFRWCIDLHEQYFGDGVGGIVALFLHRVTIRGCQNPEWIWVIVGDIPSVYLEFEGFPSPRAALSRYIEGAEEWLAASPEARESGEIIPIDVPPEPELLDALAGRIKTLRTLVLPHLKWSENLDGAPGSLTPA
jgi:hypothetical protein